MYCNVDQERHLRGTLGVLSDRLNSSDGIEGAVVMTAEGSVLASEFLAKSQNDVNETNLAAITSSIWNSYAQSKYRCLIIIFVNCIDNDHTISTSLSTQIKASLLVTS